LRRSKTGRRALPQRRARHSFDDANLRDSAANPSSVCARPMRERECKIFIRARPIPSPQNRNALIHHEKKFAHVRGRRF
jgi:hypothetical protein